MQYTDIIVFLLIFVRCISFLGSSPIFMIRGIPNIVKVGLGLLLSYLAVSFVTFNADLLPSSLIALISMAVVECILGLTLGFITTLVFQAVRSAGQLMDIQVGFSMSSEFDVTGLGNVTLLGNLSYLTAVLIFFLIDGHHILIQCLVQSFDIIPVMGTSIPPEVGPFVLSLFINMFILALKLAAPILITLFLTDFTMGLISRTVPQLNILMMGLPVKVIIGLTVLAMVMPNLVQVIIKAIQGMPVDLNNFFKLFPLAIVFASSDKTEEATPKKKEDARKKGQVAKSREFVSAVTLIGVALLALAFADSSLKIIEGYLTRSIANSSRGFVGQGDLMNIFIFSFSEFLQVTLPIFLGVMILGVMANIVQTGFIHSTEPLKPKLSRLNPLEGFKRMFSGRSFMELLKSIANISIVGYVAYNFVSGQLSRVFKTPDMGINSLLAIPKDIVQSEIMTVAIVVCVIGVIDLIYQKRAYNKDLRMTKQEIKEEYKQAEGDPKIKSAIRQRQRQMAARRMMYEVPKATVVITNPTHFAVALRYEQGRDGAPTVVAKGADEMARRIKKIANENNVPIIENKPVARMLYERVEIDQGIPVEMYQAVAEILAVVYSLNKSKRKKSAFS